MENIVLDHVIEALNKVDERFYSIEDIAFGGGELIDLDSVRKLERRFMGEFAHRYASIIDDNKSVYKSSKYDFEVPKKFMWYENPDIRIRQTWEKLNDRFLGEVDMLDYWTQEPDFLVHANQKNKQPEYQKLVIEAKVNPNTSKNEALKDIFHTCIYANKYNFQNNVLLLVNISKDKWLSWLGDYVNNDYYHGSYRVLNKIFVIFKESYSSDAEVLCLNDLIK
ncbi:hypothetical protein [Vibrio owensii]|uniref:hypothetical protein n=1 Tax=Vibrio owensii TaxID=696485 RepID=UPI003AAE42E0